MAGGSKTSKAPRSLTSELAKIDKLLGQLGTASKDRTDTLRHVDEAKPWAPPRSLAKTAETTALEQKSMAKLTTELDKIDAMLAELGRTGDGESVLGAVGADVLKRLKEAEADETLRPLSGSLRQAGKLYVGVVQGWMGNKAANAFVSLAVDKQVVRTATLKSASNPVWNQQFLFDVTHADSEVSLQVFTVSKDGTETFQAGMAMKLGEKDLAKGTAETYRLTKRSGDRTDYKLEVKLQFQVAEEKKMVVEDFDLLSVLGKGSFGKVMLVRKRDTQRLYAMKVLQKESIIQREEVEHTMAEKEVLQSIYHPYIVNLKFAFQNKEKLYLVLDFINGGELFFHLQTATCFSEERAKFYVAELVLALEYLHSIGVVYRDLKPENLLLDGDGHCVMTDFGLCKTGINYGLRTYTLCGSLDYLAPEVLNCDGYSSAVDWWSLGILLYELVSGLAPFHDNDDLVLCNRILEMEIVYPSYFSKECKSLCAKLLERNPDKRLGGGPLDGAEIRRHPFFKGIDWDLLRARQVEPPYRPKVKNDTDVSLFDPMFTGEAPKDSLVVSNLSTDEQDNFTGFSYVASSGLQ